MMSPSPSSWSSQTLSPSRPRSPPLSPWPVVGRQLARVTDAAAPSARPGHVERVHDRVRLAVLDLVTLVAVRQRHGAKYTVVTTILFVKVPGMMMSNGHCAMTSSMRRLLAPSVVVVAVMVAQCPAHRPGVGVRRVPDRVPVVLCRRCLIVKISKFFLKNYEKNLLDIFQRFFFFFSVSVCLRVCYVQKKSRVYWIARV